jgi:hypothetical protein
MSQVARLSADDISLIDKADDIGIPGSIGDTVCQEMIYVFAYLGNLLGMHFSLPHLGHGSGPTVAENLCIYFFI